MKVVDSDATARPRRTPVGVYDPQLVTRTGEDILEKYDDYGIKFLRQEVGKWDYFTSLRTGGWWIANGFDYRLVRLFFLSMLWRCGASSRNEAEHTDILAFETDLRALVRDGDVGDPALFPTMLGWFAYDVKALPVVPFHTIRAGDRIDHVALIYGYQVDINSTGIDYGAVKSNVLLRPGQPWLIPINDWRGSVEYQSSVDAVIRNIERWNAFPAEKDLSKA